MLDEKINQKYLKKIKLFQKYNKHYYDLNDPLVNDQEFDKLKLEIIELEKKSVVNNHGDHAIFFFDVTGFKTISEKNVLSFQDLVDNRIIL